MIPITGHTQLTALLGSPVAHSISPLMHNEAFHLLDLDYTYLCFDVNEENLEAAVTGLKTCRHPRLQPYHAKQKQDRGASGRAFPCCPTDRRCEHRSQ